MGALLRTLIRRAFVHWDTTLAGVLIAIGLPDPGPNLDWHAWALRIGALAIGALTRGAVNAPK